MKFILSLIAIIFLFLIPAEPEAIGSECTKEDITTTCCPPACVVMKGKKWMEGNKVLRECMMKQLGCSEDDANASFIANKCHCR